MTTRILFVCLGNICRSPAAEAVFRHKAAGLEVETDSAGTGSWHLGEPPYAPMQDAARRRGYDMSDLRARQVRPGDFDVFELIIVMDDQNLRDVEHLRGQSRTPVRLFTDYAQSSATSVPDPYYSRDFDGALSLIERCSDGLCAAIRAGGATS